MIHNKSKLSLTLIESLKGLLQIICCNTSLTLVRDVERKVNKVIDQYTGSFKFKTIVIEVTKIE